MIPALIWKEWREQRAILIAVLAFGAVTLAATAQFAESRAGGSVWEQIGPKELLPQALAYLAGAVCGAMLLADEKEVGTLEYLDGLPCRRRSVWLGKAAAGGTFAVFQAAALAAMALGLGCTDPRLHPVEYALLMVLIGLLSFAWGAFGGAMARSTLGAVFQGSVGSIVAGVVLAVPFVIVFKPYRFNQPFGPVMLAYFVTWAGSGLLLSALVFTRPDRRRATWAPEVGPADPARRLAVRGPGLVRRRTQGLWALVWLTIRQALLVTLGVCGAGVVLGFVMLLPDIRPLLLWPGVTVGIGVLAGVTALGEEQTRGVARFWAERRLPLGRMWLTKVALHFALAALAALLLYLPMAVVSPNLPFRSRLMAGTDIGLRPELGRVLWLGLVYGFALGHLAGMLFRKTAVAGLVAGLLAVTCAGLVAPSVLAGGARGWQVWAPAVVLLVTARWLLYPWATERVATAGPVLRAAGGSALAAALLAGGLAYRVYQVPDVSDRLAESGYLDGLPPTVEANETGRQAQAAANQYRRAVEAAAPFAPAQLARPGGPRPAARGDLLERVGGSGWGPGAEALGPWLDKVFAAGWVTQLVELDGKPPGVFLDPRATDYQTQIEPLRVNLREMTWAVRARGMQRLREGDPAEYPRLLRGALAAVRTARFKGGWGTAEVALDCEAVLLNGLTEWLARVGRRPDLVRPLVAALDRHAREMDTDPDDLFWADQVVYRNTVDRVGNWLSNVLDPRAGEGRGLPSAQAEAEGKQAEAEANLIAFTWNLPWEKARQERIVRYRTHRELEVRPDWLSGLHLHGKWRTKAAERLVPRDRWGLSHRRLALVQTALWAYALDHGRPALALAALVPDYLPAVPEDPFAPGQVLRYRVSDGEEIQVETPRQLLPPTATAAGVGVAIAAVRADGPGMLWALVEAYARRPPTARIANDPPDSFTLPPPTVIRPLAVQGGTGILWSTGPDGVDDGGRRTGTTGPGSGAGQDWVIVIPPP